jgi:hypothetical protein
MYIIVQIFLCPSVCNVVFYSSLSLFHNTFRPHAAIFSFSSLDGTCCTPVPCLHSVLVFGPRGSALNVLVPSVICNTECLLCLLFDVC